MSTNSMLGEVKMHSTWMIVMGVVIAALGLLLIAYPLATAAITTMLLGWALVFVGIAHFIFALHSHSAGRFFLKALSSLLFVICGLLLAFFPIQGVAALTGFLGVLLLAQAGLLLATAFNLRPTQGWGWFLADGIASLLLGILILARWPSSSIWAIGTLVGVAVLMSGITRIGIASRIRGAAGTMQHFTKPA